MLKYVGLRVLHAIPVLIGITIASFLLIHLVPGNPARIQLGPRATAAAVRLGPSSVSTELGPTIGRSGDSPVSEGAS